MSIEESRTAAALALSERIIKALAHVDHIRLRGHDAHKEGLTVRLWVNEAQSVKGGPLLGLPIGVRSGFPGQDGKARHVGGGLFAVAPSIYEVFTWPTSHQTAAHVVAELARRATFGRPTPATEGQD